MKLNENPDHIIYKGKSYKYDRTRSYAFGMNKEGEMIVGKPYGSHDDIFPNTTPDKFYGRLFVNEKVITFWNGSYPKTKSELMECIFLINNILKTRKETQPKDIIDIKNWMIQTPEIDKDYHEFVEIELYSNPDKYKRMNYGEQKLYKFIDKLILKELNKNK